MKIKVLSRNPDRYFRESKQELHKLPRNYDPNLHPFEIQREYTRAVNAAKLERVFAKPFLGALDGHSDIISCLAKHPQQLSTLCSGAVDGIVKHWNIPRRTCIRTIKSHEGYVRGITFNPSGETMITIGDDKNIRFWPSLQPDLLDRDSEHEETSPLHTIITKYQLNAISHHAKKSLFATSGDSCLIWEGERGGSEPLNKFDWGVDTLNHVSFNQSQTNVIGACASNRSIILYDIRGGSPIRKVVLALRSNTLKWNPMEPFIFAVANEDYNSYSFDMRRLKYPLNVYMDHVSAVIDLDWSPTGKELVSGSYDKTVRIFEADNGHSRDVYHTKRMQRLTAVSWSLDNKYIFSGSDEMNIRIWKAKAWEKLGILKTREKEALNYNESLKEKFGQFPKVKRILRHRHVPKHVYQAKKEIRIIKDSRKRKESNRRTHSKPGSVPFVSERSKSIVSEME